MNYNTKPIEEFNLPDKLYKYRCWSDSDHKKVITDSQVYFAPHKTFGERSVIQPPIIRTIITRVKK